MDRRPSRFRSGAGAFLGLAALFIPVMWAAAAPGLTVSPDKGKAGTTVTVSGSGFEPHGVVTVLWDGVAITDVVTGASGGFSLGVTVPDVGPGAHDILAVSLTGRASARFVVEVAATTTTKPATTTTTTAAETTTTKAPETTTSTSTTTTPPPPPASSPPGTSEARAAPPPATVATTTAPPSEEASEPRESDGGVAAAMPAETSTTSTAAPTTTTIPPAPGGRTRKSAQTTVGRLSLRPSSATVGSPVAVTLTLPDLPAVADLRLLIERTAWGDPIRVTGPSLTVSSSVPDLHPGTYPVTLVAGDRVLASTRFTVIAPGTGAGAYLVALFGGLVAGVGWWAGVVVRRRMPFTLGPFDAWYAWWEGRRW